MEGTGNKLGAAVFFLVLGGFVLWDGRKQNDLERQIKHLDERLEVYSQSDFSGPHFVLGNFSKGDRQHLVRMDAKTGRAWLLQEFVMQTGATSIPTLHSEGWIPLEEWNAAQETARLSARDVVQQEKTRGR